MRPSLAVVERLLSRHDLQIFKNAKAMKIKPEAKFERGIRSFDHHSVWLIHVAMSRRYHVNFSIDTKGCPATQDALLKPPFNDGH